MSHNRMMSSITLNIGVEKTVEVIISEIDLRGLVEEEQTYSF